MIAEKSNETWEWTIEMGATWAKNDNDEYFLYPYGGHTVMRSIAQGDGGGANVTGPFAEKLKELGVEVETKRMLTELVKDANGRVIGAIVHDKPSGNDVESGTPVAIKASGISCVIAANFARIFYRNAINIGLAILECPAASAEIENGDEVTVDFDTGVITDVTKGTTYQAEPFPPFIKDMIARGGLMASLKAKEAAK